jgi:nucleotide-binding universal stress UspA family protein
MYRNILVPIDSSDTARRGLQEAIGLARGLRARLVILNVIDTTPLVVEMAAATSETDMRDALRRDAQSLLASARLGAEREDVESEVVVGEIMGGRIAEAVIDEAKRRGCDLIVMGTHGRRGLSHLVLGSDAEAVVRLSDVPVLLVRCSAR